MYKGKTETDIRKNITYSQSVRYLTELSILNEKERSRLDEISDKKSDQEESISRNKSMVHAQPMIG